MTKSLVILGAIALSASTAVAQESVSAQERAHAKGETFQVAVSPKVRMPLEAQVVTGAPYSAETVTESVQVLPDGNRIVHRSTGRVYRDGEGRVRREEDRGAGQQPAVFITDPVAKVSYALDPDNKIAMRTSGEAVSTFHYFNTEDGGSVMLQSGIDPAEVEKKRVIEKKMAAAAAQAEPKQVVEFYAQTIEAATGHEHAAWDQKVEKLASKQIEGVTAEGTRTTRTIPAGAIGNERPISMVTEEWRSPDLQVLVSTTTSDPRTGESTYKLTNIVRGEPGASWFEVPAGFSVNDAGVKKTFVIKRDMK